MPLEETVSLDISDALSKIDDIETALGSAAQNFASALAEATAVLSSIRVEEVDASAVTTGIDEAIAAANTPATVEADASTITTSIDEAVAAATPPPVQTEADTSTLGASIDDAVAAATPAPIEVPVDAESITGSIDAALGSVDTSGLQGELDSTAGSASNLAGASKEAGLGIGSIAPAAALATGETGALSEIVGQVTPGMAGMAAATVGVVAAGKTLFSSALEQNTALTRLRNTYGDLTSAVEHVNFGGINEDLAGLAVRTGANVDGLRNFAASFGVLGQSAGDSLPHIAGVSQEIQLLAVRASVMNPNLGSADEIVQRLSTSLARGGRFLSAYGIALSTAQINAEALRETGKTTASELSIYDKIVAGATLSTQQLGGALGTDINKGAQTAQVQLRSLKAAFEETLKSAGAPLIQPVIEAFRELEPVLAALAEILGTTLAGALHVIGPILSALADVLGPIAAAAKEIPTPVIEAATAFLLFNAVGGILAGALDSIVSFATLGGLSFAGFGATAEAAAAEVDAAAASMEVAEVAAAGPIAAGFAAVAAPVLAVAAAGALLGFAYARLTDDSAKLNAGTGDLKKGFADLHSDLDQVVQRFLFAQEQANVTGTSFFNVGLDIDKASELVLRGKNGYVEFLDTLVATGKISQEAADKLRLTGESAQVLQQQANTGQVAVGRLNDSTVSLIDTFRRAQETTRNTAHEVLTAAVAHHQLSREEELTAIAAHTAHDGHVDWIGVLEQLRPSLEAAGTAAQVFGQKADLTNPVVQHAADVQKQWGDAVDQARQGIERGLVSSGRYTQAQVDQANAMNTNKDGTIDYGKALDSLGPGLSDVASADATLAIGLDDTANKFNRAQAEAKFYENALNELLNPIVSATDADVRWHQSLQDTADALAKNGNTVDLNTKAGRDNVSAVDAQVTAGATLIDKMISEGATTDQLTAKKAEIIGKLREEEQHYPALTPLIDTYIGKIDAIPLTHLTQTGLPNTPQNISDASNIKAAIEAIHGTNVFITADGSQARAEIEGVSISITSLQHVADQNPIHIKIGGVDIPQGSGVTRTPGGGFSLNIGPGAMAGGTFDPWQSVLVGEAGPEIVTFPQQFTVHPNDKPPQGNSTTTVNVFEVAKDPQATAFAVSTELARKAKR